MVVEGRVEVDDADVGGGGGGEEGEVVDDDGGFEGSTAVHASSKRETSNPALGHQPHHW